MNLYMDSQSGFQSSMEGSGFQKLGSAKTRLGKPPLPQSRPSTGLKLAPLGNEAPATPDVDELRYSLAFSSSPELTSSGHLGVVRNMRRSIPSPIRHSFPMDAAQSRGLSKLPWGSRMAELAAPTWGSPAELAAPSWSSMVDQSVPKRSQNDVRKRRVRSGADFGAQLRHQSCTAIAADLRSAASGAAPSCTQSVETFSEQAAQAPTQAANKRPARCDSMPPTGTSKADADAAASAKARAVATLQRLFFEEVAKVGQDPNGAAARALLRLSEVSQQEVSPTSEEVKVSHVPLVPPPEMEVPVEMPDSDVQDPEMCCTSQLVSIRDVQALDAWMKEEAPEASPAVPRRPSEKSTGARRPAPRGLSRAAVRN